jgi:2,3,4,5-tetrahydropyridine-2-carboxylate N-succinyltransferase
VSDLRTRIEAAFADRSLLKDKAYEEAVLEALAQLDAGTLRVATPEADGSWTVNAWAKQAILLYFAVRAMETIEVGPFEYHDKIPLKKNLAAAGVRVVPPGVARYGRFVEKGAILMPGYVNLGAWVGAGTMVDTWATVGSCAQIGATCTSRAASASAGCSSPRRRAAGDHRGRRLHRQPVPSWSRACASSASR